ncbi:MAG: 50S ribosomal protein L29 [Patescibacteria group bacterium]
MAKKLDYKTNTPDELNKIVADKREQLRTLRFNVAGSKNKDVKAASKLRKEIARALTAINAPTKAAK